MLDKRNYCTEFMQEFIIWRLQMFSLFASSAAPRLEKISIRADQVSQICAAFITKKANYKEF